MSLNLDSIHSEFILNMASDGDRVVYSFEEYRLDKTHRMLYCGARELTLPPKAVETLIALIELRGEIVSKDELMKMIWKDTVVEESNLAHYLYLLRKTLGQKSDGRSFIETFRRRGYRFTSDVQVIGEVETLTGNGKKDAPDLRERLPNADLDHRDNSTKPSAESRGQTTVRLPRYWLSIAAAGILVVFVAAGTFLSYQWLSKPSGPQAGGNGEVSITPLTSGNAVLDATISPDGKYFVYHEEDQDRSHLWLQQTGQTGRIEIVSPAERDIKGKTFSPNNEFVYFVSREKGDTQDSLYRVPTLGGPLTKVLIDIASPVSFSRDGQKIAFARYNEKAKEYHLVTASADGEQERILLTRSGRESLSLGNTWSPDGKFIGFGVFESSSSGEGNCSISAVEVQTLAVKNISAERWDTCYRMVWTNDGNGLIFIGTRAGESYTTRRDQVYHLSVADGRSRRISTDGSRYQTTSLGLTTDNSLLVVPQKKLSQIWVMSADGDARTAVQLTNGQADGNAGVASLPDGRIGYISRVGENLTIWIMDHDGSNQRQISDHLPFVEELRATPDGRFFIFSARRDGFSHLYRIDANGQNLKQLTDGESYEIDSTVSPDSHWVYYGSNVFNGRHWKTHLRKTSIDNGQTIELKELDTLGLVPNISHDGKSIAGVTYGGLKIFSSFDGTELDSLRIDKLSQLGTGAKWTPDGRSLTYHVFRENSINIWVQPISGSAPRPLTNFPKGYVYFHAFSQDGTKLYVARGYQVRDAVMIKTF